MINVQFVEMPEHGFLEVLGGGDRIASDRDVLEILSLCGEYHTNRVLFHGASLSPDFIELSTGLAGQILLKLTIYHVKAAVILTREQINHGKFYEFALETNRRSNEFRVFTAREEALTWLCG